MHLLLHSYHAPKFSKDFPSVPVILHGNQSESQSLPHSQWKSVCSTYSSIAYGGLGKTVHIQSSFMEVMWVSPSLSFCFLFYFFWHLYWSIIALQCCVSCCCITKWISYTYTYIPISPPSCVSLPPSLSHPSRWSQSTELISLCYAAASH